MTQVYRCVVSIVYLLQYSLHFNQYSPGFNQQETAYVAFMLQIISAVMTEVKTEKNTWASITFPLTHPDVSLFYMYLHAYLQLRKCAKVEEQFGVDGVKDSVQMRHSAHKLP